MSKIFFSQSMSNKTFRPKRNVKERFQLSAFTEQTLGSGNLEMAVILPEGEDVNEWVACNAVDFYNQLNLLYGSIAEHCTKCKCPIMNAGKKIEYHWAPDNRSKPVRLDAPAYCDNLWRWIDEQLDNENLFPSEFGQPFPKNFATIVKMIFRRLFRVYAHIYHSHFQDILKLDEEAHLNTSFKHFYYFVNEYSLVDKREMMPLGPLIERIIRRDQERYGKRIVKL